MRTKKPLLRKYGASAREYGPIRPALGRERGSLPPLRFGLGVEMATAAAAGRARSAGETLPAATGRSKRSVGGRATGRYSSASSSARRARARVRHCLLYTSPSPRDGLLSRM